MPDFRADSCAARQTARRRLAGPVAGLLLLALGFAWGFLAHRYRLFPYYLLAGWSPETVDRPTAGEAHRGWFSTEIARLTTRPTDGLTSRERALLGSVGYLPGYEPAPDELGVRVHAPDRACQGYNLYVSGHAPEAVLMDMDGRVLHRWHYAFRAAWPDLPIPEGEDPGRPDFWRRAYLYPNGDLLAIFHGLGLIKLDRESRLLWKYADQAHHDLDVAPDGRIFVLTRERHGRLLEDFVSILDPDGRPLKRVSVLQALTGSPHAHLLRWRPKGGDVTHANTVEVLDGRLADRLPAFQPGRVLLSLRSLDALAVLDPESERIVWARTGPWRQQHEPTVLDNGHLLVFDNRGRDGFSRVLEYDPVADRIVWQFAGNADNGFFSRLSGACARLPNGNTLITQTDSGRAFEITPAGQIVWEFLNPNRAGPNGEMIAVLFEVVRLPPDFPLDWLD